MLRIIGILPILMIYGCSGSAGAPAGSTPPFSTDTRNDLHEVGRPANWQATFKNLGDSGFRAAVGPVTYQDIPDRDPDYYSIDIERPDGGTSYVIFQQDFLIDDIHPDSINADATDVVQYDETIRTVTFIIGEETIRYVLPDTP